MWWAIREPREDARWDAHRESRFYEPGMAGYRELVERGWDAGRSGEVLPALLVRADVPDFLHGRAQPCPFLLSDRAAAHLRGADVTGVRFGAVDVVKIASRARHATRVDPACAADAIVRARNVLGEVAPPSLHAAHVIGRVDVECDDPSGRVTGSPLEQLSMFDPPAVEPGAPDLWQPRFRGERHGVWTFCSERFRRACIDAELTNVGFEPIESFVARRREFAELVRSGSVTRKDLLDLL